MILAGSNINEMTPKNPKAKRKATQDPTTGKLTGGVKLWTTEAIWEKFLEYVKWAKSNPRKENVLIPKEAFTVAVDRERPLTWNGFYAWLFQNKLPNFEHYRLNKDGVYPEFIDVLNQMHYMIWEDNYSGGAVGIFNPTKTSKYIGLVDKQEVDVTSKGEQIMPAPVFKLNK